MENQKKDKSGFAYDNRKEHNMKKIGSLAELDQHQLWNIIWELLKKPYCSWGKYISGDRN